MAESFPLLGNGECGVFFAQLADMAATHLQMLYLVSQARIGASGPGSSGGNPVSSSGGSGTPDISIQRLHVCLYEAEAEAGEEFPRMLETLLQLLGRLAPALLDNGQDAELEVKGFAFFKWIDYKKHSAAHAAQA